MKRFVVVLSLLTSLSAMAAPEDEGPDGALHYTFDGTGASLADSGAAHARASLYGAELVASGSGRALQFDGAKAFARCADRSQLLFGSDDFSVQFWLMLADFTPGIIMGKKGDAADSPGWLIQAGPGNKQITAVISSMGKTESVSAPIGDFDWHAIAMTRHGNICTLYVDGKTAASKTSETFRGDVDNRDVFFNLGRVLGNTRSFKGELGNVLIRSSALLPGEIAEAYKYDAPKIAARQPKGTESDGLVLHYRFDADPRGVAKDLSGHGNDGKIVDGQYLPELDGRKGVLRLNGTSSLIDCGKSDSICIRGDMSFEFWIRQNGPIKSQWALIFGEDPPINFTFTEAYWHSISLWYRSSDIWLEDMILPVERKAIGEQWSHLAVVLEYPRCHYYLNGQLIRDELMPVPGLANYQNVPKRIGGATYGGGRYFPMDLTEFRLYNRALTAAEVAAHAADREAAPAPAETLAVEPNWYKDLLTLRLTSQGRDVRGAQAQLQLFEDGKPVTPVQTVKLENVSENTSRRDEASCSFPLLAFRDHHLKAQATILGANGAALATVSKDITLTKPDWIQTRDGYSDKVLPPWTPLKTEATDSKVLVDVWNRQQAFGNTPFLQQITNGPATLLQSPISLSGESGGRPISWTSAPVKLLSSSETQAAIRQSAQADGLDLVVNSEVDYDGYTIFDCELKATRDVLFDKLFLDIPLDTRYASLCYGDEVFAANTAIPMAEWYSGAVKGNLAFRFSPDIWLGNQERGLCWQAESDQDWHYADSGKAIEIMPQGNTTLFHAHFIDVPTKLQSGHSLHYKFALLATPVKPLTRDAWSLRIARGEPYGRDLELAGAKASTGKAALQMLYDEGVRHLFFNVNDIWCWPMPVHPEFAAALHKLIDEAHAIGLKLYPYLIHQRVPVGVPEFDIYGMNMARRPLKQYLQYGQPPGTPRQGPITVNFGADSQGSVFMCANSEALQDAFIHSLAERLKEYGDDGVYLDGTVHIPPCRNTDHGCGYMGADGKLHDTYPVFGIRNFMKRIYTVVKSRNPDGVVDAHCSWGYNPAALAYADVMWNGEQWHHLAGTGTRYVPGELTLDKFQTEFTGYQIGVASETLAYRLGSNIRVASVSLLHDISPRLSTNGFQPIEQSGDPYFRLVPKIWKMRDDFGAEEAEKLFYWNNQKYVSVTPDQCYCTLLKHPRNGVLAFVSNLSRTAQKVEVTLNLDALGLKGRKLDVFNALDETPLSLSADGKISLPLNSQAWAYIWLKPAIQ